jgi:type IV pilus assembly protein PilA
MDDQEQGFTLIELLVVIIFIGILSAIALPVYLNQKTKGFEASMKSDLRQTAALMESYATDSDTYPAVISSVAGVRPSPGNTIVIVSSTETRFCLSVTNTKVKRSFYWASDQGGLLAPGASCV